MQNIFLPPNGKGILCQDKSCLVLNTKGSARTLSQFALVHSSEGKFIRPQNPKHSLRLVSGGHGQKGMELLKKYGMTNGQTTSAMETIDEHYKECKG